MHSLESEANRKLQALQHLDRDTYEAVIWLRQNKDVFNGIVYEPAYLTVSVIESSLTDAVESVVRRSSLLTFTCISREDYLIFTQQIVDKLKLNVSVVEFSNTANPELSSFRPFCTREELKSYGFEGWIIDFIKGPHPVLNTLCHIAQLHLVAYTRTDLTNAQLEAIEQRLDGEGRPSFRSYICGGTSFTLSRSQYGSKNIIVQTRRVFPARYLKDKGIDQSKKRELLQTMKTLKDELEKLFEVRTKAKESLSSLKNQYNQINVEKDQLGIEKEKITKEFIAWNRLQVRIDDAKEQIENMDSTPNDSQQNIAILQEKIKDSLLQRESQIKETLSLSKNVWNAYKHNIASGIANIKNNNDYEFYEEQYRQANQELEEQQEQLQELRKTYVRLRKEVKDMYERLSSDIAQLTPEEQDEMNRLSRQYEDDEEEVSGRLTLDRLNGQIAAANDSLSLIHDGNAHVIEQHEQRAIEILRLQRKINDDTSRSKQMEVEINDIRTLWETDLDTLVSRISTEFSAAFEFIGCAGEVRIGKPEDYDKWSIEIMVKFRETEQLQQLTHQRQSGGERSVSTIFYLMALQGVTKAPFRVVDEINQGMDPRNERMVHSRMVNVACQEHSTQYFLITPKLLPELIYHPKMVVHCIFSGDFMPDTVQNHEKLSLGRLSKYVEVGKRLKLEAMAH